MTIFTRATARRVAVLASALLATLAIAHAQTSSRLLVLDKDDAELIIIDPSSGMTVGHVPVGRGPHEAIVSTDGKFAFASNYGTGPEPGHTISMIDLAAQREVRRVDVSPLTRPHGLAFAGGKLYFTAEGSKRIARYDPVANKIDWEFETGLETTHMVLVTNDERRLFTSNIRSNSVSIIERDAKGAWTQTAVAVGKGPEGIDMSPDGKTVWSAHSQDGGVSVIDADTKKVVHTIDVGSKLSNRLKLTPDGKHALISDVTSGEIIVLDTATRRVVKRVAVGKNPEGILVVPNGTVAYVALNSEKQVAVLSLKTWDVVKRIETGAGPDGMAWKP